MLWWQHEPMATQDRKPITHRRDRHAYQDRRLQAAELFAQDTHQAEVARTLGVSRQTASRWHQRWQANGPPGLRSAGPPGRTPRLGPAQLDTAEQARLQRAKANGSDTELWALDRIPALSWRATGVRHHPPHVWRLLRNRRYSPLQRPARRANARNEQTIRQWVARDWPRIRQKRPP